MNIWESLRQPPSSQVPEGTGVWKQLCAKTDPSKYVPRKIELVEESNPQASRGGSYFVVKNREKVRYLKLTDEDYFLWSQIDGKSSFGDLVMAYFQKFGAFAFNRINSLLEQLKTNYFLEEKPVRIFSRLNRLKEKETFTGKMTRLVRSFLQKEVPFPRLDKAISFFYDKFFWPFFTQPAKWLYTLLSIAGVFCFAVILHSGSYNIVETQGSYLLGVVILVVLQIFIILLHEGAHAFATKSYGRQVPRGGFMLYMGMPAFFVDTTDMWLEKKGKRMAVSWAGPYAEMVMGGIFALFMTFFPEHPANPILFKCVFLFYIGVFINMNPLLELDGYYILVDLLEIPMLRRRSFRFVQKDLIRKLRKKEPFSKTEKIFTVFGTLAAVYTAFAISAALYFWQTRLLDSLIDIWNKGLISKIFVGLLVAVSLGPLVLFLFIKTLKLIRWCWNQVTSSPVFRKPNQASPVLLLLTGAAGLFGFLQPWFDLSLIAAAGWLVLFLTSAHFLFWNRSRIFPKSPWSVPVCLFLGALSFQGIGLLLALRQEDALVSGTLSAGLILLSLTALLSLPYIQRQTSWTVFSLLAASAAGWLALGGIESGLFTLSQLGFSLLAVLSFSVYVSWLDLWKTEEKPLTGKSDEENLKLALIALTENFKQSLKGIYSKRIALKKWDRLNSAVFKQVPELSRSSEGQWSFQDGLSILELSRAGQKAFELLWRKMGSHLGAYWSDLFLAKTLDSLDWQQREILDQYLFTQSDWKSRVDSVAGERRGLETILKNNFLFADLTEEEVGALAKLFVKEEFKANQKIITQGEVGDKFYLIRSGVVVVRIKSKSGLEEEVARLSEGDFFGEIALLKEVPRTATCLAQTPVSVWSLDKESFSRYVKEKFSVSISVERAVEIMRLLGAMPLFKDLTPTQMRKLALSFTSKKFPDGEAIIRQGDPGDAFYVIEKGKCSVQITDPDGNQKEVAKLGKGEYFGEMALLSNAPRSATIKALAETELLVLSKEDFDKMILATLASSGGLEKVSSRRKLDLKKKLTVGA